MVPSGRMTDPGKYMAKAEINEDCHSSDFKRLYIMNTVFDFNQS
jgi:hypothetical protein